MKEQYPKRHDYNKAGCNDEQHKERWTGMECELARIRP